MAPEVKPERLPYRQRQALETKALIARTARSLFSDRGYAGTSIEAIAAEAGVSPRTIYGAFGTKKAILAAICSQWLAEAGVAEAINSGLATDSLGDRLRIVAHASRRQWETEGGIRVMLEGAAASDAEVSLMLAGWKNDRGASFRRVFSEVDSQLRPDLDTDTASAVLRALMGAEIYFELVAGEGWSPHQYETWVAEMLSTLLLPPENASADA